MWKTVSFILLIAQPATAQEADGCMDCEPPAGVPIYCASYLPEGWWDVPEGTSPQVVGIEDTNGYWTEGGSWFKGQAIVTEPTSLTPPQRAADGELLIYYMGEYLSWIEVEERTRNLVCPEMAIS